MILLIVHVVRTRKKSSQPLLPLDETPLILRDMYKDLQMDEKTYFDQFCQQVGLDEECGEKSWTVWESVSTKLSKTAKGTLIPWFVCAAYVMLCHKKYAAVQAGESGRAQHSVHDLLKVAKMRMVDFFEKMKEFAGICDVRESVTESLTELKRKFCISSALFYKFKRVMPVVLNDRAFCCESEKAKESFFKTCWLLFIVCKDWQSHQVGDLMTAFYLLLCCVDFVHQRLFISRQKCTDVSELETNVTLEQGILPELCQESNVPYSMVNAIHSQYFQPFHDSKCSATCLLEIDDLNSTYEEIYRKYQDVDERDFFEKDGCLWTPLGENNSNGTDILNGGSVVIPGHESSVIATITSSRGPYLSPAVNDLRAELNKMSDSPSEELVRFWKCCKRNPQELIHLQLTDVLGNFIEAFTEGVSEENSNACIPNEIFSQAKRLYYRVMEAMLLAEEKRLSCSDFSALLNSKAFHLSLLACSLEVVIADKSLQWPVLKFPWILNVLGLKAFDFFKVIESFVLHEPLLGSNLVKHLNWLEEQVLDSLAWTAESPVLTAMGAAASDSSSECTAQQPKKSQPLNLNLFLRKVNLLAYNRLVSLCSKLDVDDTLRCHMWTCLEQSLRQHWHLLKDRHLDEMILCAVYAISKVLCKEIQFKQIVTSYKSLHFASSQVYRGDCDKVQDTIIGFYNGVYMVAMKPIILQFAPNKIPPVSPAPRMSVRVAGKKNFYLSPLRKSPSEALTPRSRSLYSFGDSPGSGDRESLSRINASVRAVYSQPNVPQKRLRFDGCDVNESPPTLEEDKASGADLTGTNEEKLLQEEYKDRS